MDSNVGKPPPRKRNDRSEKLIAKKGLDEKVVKCSLSGLVLGDIDCKTKYLDAIEERVLVFSQRYHIASISLSLLVKELFDKVLDKDIKNVKIPFIFEPTFIRQLLVGTKESIKPEQCVVDLHNRYPILLDKLEEIPRHLADRNIMSAGAIKFVTNVKTHLEVNFLRMVKKWVYSDTVKGILKAYEYDEGIETKKILYSLMNFESYPLILPEAIQHDYEVQKDIIGNEKINESWIKSPNNKEKLLKYFVFINRFIEQENTYLKALNLDEHKTYNLLPLSNLGRSFITIDTHSLFGIVKECGKVRCSGTTFYEQKDYQWSAFLNYGKVQGSERTFTGTIETDGVSVCIHFTKPKVKVAKTEFNRKDKTVDVLGVDPGRTNIYYASKELSDGSIRSYKLSRKQYYVESGMVNAQENSKVWNQGIRDKLQILSENTPKVMALDKFLKYVNAKMETFESVFQEYSKRRWGHQKFRLYGGKKRAFAAFWNNVEREVEPGKRLVVAFGASKFAPGGKSEVSVPTSRAFKECQNRFPTYAVDEFRTSKIYWRDQETILHKVKRLDKAKEVRGLLWCGSTNQERSKLINRDLNGAMNIRKSLLAPSRPSMLFRSSGVARINQGIKCFLRC